MNNLETYRIHTIGIVSFKPNLHPLDIEIYLPLHKSKIHFRIHYDTSYYDSFLQKVKGNPKLESSSIVELIEFSEKEPIIKYLDLGCKELFNNHIGKINECIDIIRYSHEQKSPNRKIMLRNIGFDDFIYYKIQVNENVIAKRLIPCFGDNTVPPFEIENFENKVPFEWKTFQRSMDLLDTGYTNESLIVGFNLLDYCVQLTLKALMVNLSNDKQKDCLLKQIKEQRLKTYLGSLFTTLTGMVFYSDKITEKVIDNLNHKRNKIVHNGEDCNYSETCSSLKTIFQIIRLLNEKGNQKFDLPTRIIFYDDLR